MYWSAIASERAHDETGASRRYQIFLARYPTSTRAKEATAAVTRLSAP